MANLDWRRLSGVVFLAVVLHTWVCLSAASGAPLPTWDKKLSGASRFTLLWCTGSGVNRVCPAVLDKETGLVWERLPSSSVVADWDAPGTGAVALCFRSETGGRMGWRLPTVEELFSLVDPTAASAPVLPAGHPFLTVQSAFGDHYWSITSVPGTSQAFAVPFDGVGLDFLIKVGGNALIWCVRGGHGYDTP